MSESFLENPYLILLFPGLYLMYIIMFLVIRRIGKRKHLFDERYKQENSNAKARGYETTTIILLLAWPIIIMFDGIGFSFFLLSIIFVLHNLSYLFASIYYSTRE
ncbi:DUF2178 domain-containing protein [Oceanobacillus zhaokaii]|uniref:DUF2178 domain-containing protein n=1 Tax=Oceanobacillus zhaokaii TaxID=2052660 RepID=A0A345PFB6_9BACI|nr:DUF3796 domain-containing protein [Oceanobacillus zhaokaii]AXI08696.1 DUF2178 domain-containing protein [Oceanobacillus zhaokaii]